MLKIILIFIFSLFFLGCADKDPYSNKPALFWYQQIIKEAGRGNVEAAGDFYSSLQGEHIKSPLLGEAMLIMANAHVRQEEYLLANYYYDEFIKRFGDKKNIPYIKFLKLKSDYYGLQNPKRDQKLILDTKRNSQMFSREYTESIYKPFVQTITTNIVATEDQMNLDIAELYEKLDKPNAALYYKQKQASSFISNVNIQHSKSSWFRELFE